MPGMGSRRTQRGVSALGLLITLLALGAVFFFAFGRDKTVTTIDEDGQPEAVTQAEATAAAAAQMCRHECSRELRTCNAMATETAERTRCADDAASCREACEDDE